jgi:transposase InsO family protein
MSWEEYLKGLDEVAGHVANRKEPEPAAEPETQNPHPPPSEEKPTLPDLVDAGEEPVPTVPGWDEKAPGEAPAENGEEDPVEDETPPRDGPPPFRGVGRPNASKNRALRKKGQGKKVVSGEEKLLILDVWKKSGLPAKDFSGLVDLSPHSLYAWRKKLEEEGPEGLFPAAPGPSPGARVDAVTRRAILVIKQSHPEYGCERISDILYRGPGLGVSASAVSRVLKEEGYVETASAVERHPDKVRSFERARPNQMWQTDLFTFVLKRQGQRVHLVAFLDDHSRFVTGFGLASRASTGFVQEVVRSAIGAYGPPEEMLTDQGPQYHTWRGKSAFTKEMEKRGIKQIVARPRHPRTLGKIERFWGTLWRECVETAVFLDLEDARRRIAFFIDHYNFQRPHQGIGGLVPADRFFGAAPEVRKTLQARVAQNALDLARHGTPRKSFYLTGRVGDVGLSLHAEGEKVVMTTEDGRREEVDLRFSGKRAEEGADAGEEAEPLSPSGPSQPEETAEDRDPGTSPLDGGLQGLRDRREAGEERDGEGGEVA